MLCVLLFALVACSAAPARGPTPEVRRDAGVTPSDAADEPFGKLADAGVCERYDPKDPACRDVMACRHGWADCKCPDPPDVENPACWATMPCPRVPDRRVLACRATWPKCP